MAKRIRRGEYPSKLAQESETHQGNAESNGPLGEKVCDLCGKPADELTAGRCPKCYSRIIKDLHRTRGLRGF